MLAGWQRSVGVQLLAAGLAATALVASPSIADAKVVLEQPKVKKVCGCAVLCCAALC